MCFHEGGKYICHKGCVGVSHKGAGVFVTRLTGVLICHTCFTRVIREFGIRIIVFVIPVYHVCLP